MNKLLAAAIFLSLTACATPAPVSTGAASNSTGSIMQSGPADRPIAEVRLPSPGTCTMMLEQLKGTARAISRCTESSGNLPYGYEAQATALGKMQVSTIDLDTCEKMHSSMAKKESADTRLLSTCHKL